MKITKLWFIYKVVLKLFRVAGWLGGWVAGWVAGNELKIMLAQLELSLATIHGISGMITVSVLFNPFSSGGMEGLVGSPLSKVFPLPPIPFPHAD